MLKQAIISVVNFCCHRSENERVAVGGEVGVGAVDGSVVHGHQADQAAGHEDQAAVVAAGWDTHQTPLSTAGSPDHTGGP
jgi:hypothetical protein